MRFVVQRVTQASVSINNALYSQIKNGFLVLLGIEETDLQEDIDWLCNKLINLRVFSDANQKMNLSLQDIDGEILLVSQFTLFASIKKGNRPSFIKSAKPDVAIPLYNSCIKTLEILLKKKIETGVFGADMQLTLTNNGPVTILMDSKIRE